MSGDTPKRRRPVLKAFLVVLGVLAATAMVLHFPAGPVRIRPGPDTTVIDGPLNPDGTVDYVGYLDRQWREGLQPDQNAAMLLLKALGPDVLNDRTRVEILQRLGLTDETAFAKEVFVAWRYRRGKPSGEPAVSDPEKAVLPPPLPASGPASQEAEKDEADVWNDLLSGGDVHADLEPWLERNRAALELIVQASRKPRLYVPLESTQSPPMLLNALGGLATVRHAGVALALRAATRMRRGDLDGAWEDALACHRLARLGSQIPTILGQLEAISTDAWAARVGTALACHEKFAPQQERKMLSDLSALGPIGDVVGSLDRCERMVMLDSVQVVYRTVMMGQAAEIDTGGTLDWNEMMRYGNQWYDEMIRPMRLPRFGGRRQAMREYWDQFDALERRMESAKPRLLIERLGGRATRKAFSRSVMDLILSMHLPSLQRAQTLEDSARMALEVERMAAALACFKADKGRWPASLDELVPDLLPAVPVDLFSDKPLVYKPAADGYVLYSLGGNQKDDGGVRSDKPADEGDIVAEVRGRR